MNRKPIFDAIRDIFGPLNQAQVDRIDDAIDRAIAGDREREITTGKAGIDLMHRFEGFAKLRSDGKVEAYPDPATGGKPWTIGYGSTTDEAGNPISPGTVWTRKRAEDKFRQDLKRFERYVIDALDGDRVTQNQFDALVSFTYNVGPANLKRSTLLRKHKNGDYKGAAAEFIRWNKANGKVLAGLTRRREAESKLYRGIHA